MGFTRETTLGGGLYRGELAPPEFAQHHILELSRLWAENSSCPSPTLNRPFHMPHSAQFSWASCCRENIHPGAPSDHGLLAPLGPQPPADWTPLTWKAFSFFLTFYFILEYSRWTGFPGGTSGKEPTCQFRRCKRCRFNSWVRKIPLEEGTETHSSNLAWKIQWTEEPGRLQSIGWQRIGHDWSHLAPKHTPG